MNEQNIVERVETWLGDNIMGDMHIVATYSGWKDFRGVMAPAKIVQTRGGWPFFEVDVTAAKPNPPDVATLAPQPAPAGRGGQGGGAPAGAPPAGGGAARLVRGAGRGGSTASCAARPAAAGALGRSGTRRRSAGGGAPPRWWRSRRSGWRGSSASSGRPSGQRLAVAAAEHLPPLTVTNEMLGEGVWRLSTGTGSYDSLIINFKDYVMMLEAGQKRGALSRLHRGN